MAQKAEVKYDPLKIMPNQIASKISSLGFEATVLETECLGNGVVELKGMFKSYFREGGKISKTTYIN